MNPLNIRIIPRTLHFRQPAGTSRGVYTTRNVWYILIRDNTTGRIGLGECAPLPDLSCDALPDYTERLIQFCQEVEHSGKLPYDAGNHSCGRKRAHQKGCPRPR